MNYFDLIIAIAFIIAGFTGFKSGLLQSIFKTIGGGDLEKKVIDSSKTL